jgi:AraC-like DNA-binding protein
VRIAGAPTSSQLPNVPLSATCSPARLQEVANLSHMSVPAFCHYFKKCTQKTYINFLNDVRIGYACRMLTNPDHPISQICFESGFQSLQNFNKQFYKLKQVTPSDYRKRIMGKEL